MKPVNSVEAVLREILRVAPWPYRGGEPCGQYHAWFNALRSACECLGETLACPRCGAELAPTEVSEVGRDYYCTRCGDYPVTVKRIEERGTDERPLGRMGREEEASAELGTAAQANNGGTLP